MENIVPIRLRVMAGDGEMSRAGRPEERQRTC